jgi:hypothetical protein
MADYTFASVLCSAANQTALQELVGEGYFNAGFSADGTAPATRYISTGPFDNAVLTQIIDSKLFDLVSFGMETDTFGLVAVTEEPITETTEE